MKTIIGFEIEDVWHEYNAGWHCSIRIWDENNHEYVMPDYHLGETEPDECDMNEIIDLVDLEAQFNEWYMENY